MGLVPPIPRPTELELRGRPKSREVTGMEAPLFPSFDPQKQAPCRTRQLRGRGSPTLPVGGRGTKSTPHCLGAIERGRPSGQHPKFIAPYKPAEDPRFSQAPPRGTWGGGRTGRATGGGGDGSRCLWPSPLPRKGGEHEEGRGSRRRVGGLCPSPRGTFALAPLLRCIVSRRGNRGARFEIGAQ